ncbi:MAG: flagellar motor switch protein FliG, partial [Burkholderiales bacterium]|nr:flagellar motor switch protein FliG [Burkholderiales bacterium]
MSDDGIQKAATFMLALGEDGAAEVLKYLGPREVQKIGAAMAAIGPIPHENIAKVLD